jgi:hypothetical protein
MRLQLFGHRDSRYERPTVNWCCGGTDQCALGPDASGGCRAGPMCHPVRVDGVFKCARSSVSGGPCTQGPGPRGECGCALPTCTPRPTLRAQRGRLSRWAALVAVAVVLIALSVGSRERWLAGPLSMAHMEIGECSQCHVDADASASVWLHQAMTPTDPTAVSKSCLTCHDRGGDALAMAPHNQPPAVLQQWREQTQALAGSGSVPAEFRLASAVFGSATEGADTGVACATCHQEHRGGVDFKAMSDAGCQSCHTVKFDRFPDGHPEFGNFPYRKRQNIAFNHASHIDLHFPKSDASVRPENCTNCHAADSVGAGMLLTGYEGTCAACHDADIRKGPTSGPPGGPFLAVPGLDLDTLAAEGVAIGYWPDSFYEGIPPIMRALLSVGYMDVAKLDLLNGVDLLDLSSASPEVLDAVATLAWATKKMMADMLQSGVLSDAGTMRATFGKRLTPAEISRLGGTVPRDVLATAADAWFGCSLYSEVAANRDGKPPATLTIADHVDGKPPVCAGASAAVDAKTDEAKPDEAKPDQDTAPSALDALGGSALGASVLGGSALGDATAPAAESGGNILGGSALGDATAPAAESGGDILGGSALGDATAPAAESGGNILGGSTLGDATTPAAESGGNILGGSALGDVAASSGAGDILSGLASGAGSTTESDATSAPAVDEKPAIIVPEPVDPADWAQHGGWYRTAEAVYYRPVEHADGFMRAWLDFAGAAYGTPEGRGLSDAIFDAMGQTTSLGRCAKCHSGTEQADGSVVRHWRATALDTAARTVTQFRHAPHLTIAGDAGCNLCHTVAKGEAMMTSYKSFDAKGFVPGFTAMTKETCATCHAGSEAGSECQHCHNYHVGTFSTASRMGRLMTGAAKEAGK